MLVRSPLFRRALLPLVALAALGLGAACWPNPGTTVASASLTGFSADAIDNAATTTTTTTEPPTTTTEAPPPPPPPSPQPVRPARTAPPATTPPDPAPPLASGAGGQGVTLANNFRANNGVPALAQAGDANAKAQQHAEQMAANETMAHSSSLSSGISPGWTAIGENVGVGPSIGAIESMFEQSSTHRDNLLNGSYTQIGFGWAQGADGRVYVCQIFVGR